MEEDNKKNLIVKFPEDKSSPGTVLGSGNTPNNSVEEVADFLPRALDSIKENFREAVFLFIILGYIFIAAFGHMEKIENYVGYLLIFLVGILVYKIWDKITLRDIFYWILIIVLGTYFLIEKFGDVIIMWLK